MMLFTDVNYWAVLVAAITNMVIGFIWYSTPVFGTVWMKLMGLKPSDAKKVNMARAMGLMFVGALVSAFVLAQAVNYAQATTALEGAQVGFWLWLGFVATTSLGDYTFGKKPSLLYWIGNGYWLVTLLVTGAILGLWI